MTTTTNIIFHESYGTLTRAQLAAYRKHNISPSDHDGLVDQYGEENHAEITRAVKAGWNFFTGVPGEERPGSFGW
jgi:hypothetical protein